MAGETATADTNRRIVLAHYRDESAAQGALDMLIENDFPLDRVSVLGKAGSSGDDPLGVYHASIGDRVRGWGRLGALWGGLMGAASMFILPGIGPMIAAGPLAESLIGAAAGAGIGGGLMAGGAALSELAMAVHRMGVPENRIEDIEQRLRSGQYLLLLIVDTRETATWREVLQSTSPDSLSDYPYIGIGEVIVNAIDN